MFKGPGKVSNKQRKGDAWRGLGKIGRGLRKTMFGVEESAFDDEVMAAMNQLKQTKGELNAIIQGARGMVDANKTAQQSNDHLIQALLGSAGVSDSDVWAETAKNFGGVLTTVQQNTDDYWTRIGVLVDQLTAFFDEDILAANSLKDEYKQAKYEFDEAETGVNKATNEKRPEKERIRNEKRQRAEQVRVKLLDTIRDVQERKNREMTGILREYFEALKEYHDRCAGACSRPLTTGVVGGGSPKRESYVFGSASADSGVATNPFSSSDPPPPPSSSAAPAASDPFASSADPFGPSSSDPFGAPASSADSGLPPPGGAASGLPPPSFGGSEPPPPPQAETNPFNEFGSSDQNKDTNPFGSPAVGGDEGGFGGPPASGSGPPPPMVSSVAQANHGGPPPAPKSENNPFSQFS